MFVTVLSVPVNHEHQDLAVYCSGCLFGWFQ